MKIRISIYLKEPIILPLSYHHILQSFIYKAISTDARFASFVHDEGFSVGSRLYKLFTFGLIRGRHNVFEKNIIFSESIKWEIRAINDDMMELLINYILSNGITLKNQFVPPNWITISTEDVHIKKNLIDVKMDSPIVVYCTNKESGKTHYYSPDESEFVKYVSENFIRKYSAYYGEKPVSLIDFEVVSVNKSDKYVTKYKNFYITGWFGIYKIRGPLEYLDFLYYTGLGSKNSQGFGMFELL